MKPEYSAPKKAKWTFKILPYFNKEKYLVEDAPYDEDTRATYQLKEPLRAWLKNHRHQVMIDRGDFGEGAEHFYVTLYTKDDAGEFEALCESLKP